MRLLSFILILLNPFHLLQAQSQVEIDALMDLVEQYDTLLVQGWNLEGENVCEWYGVGCDDDGHITSLNLSHYYLEEELPETIGNLLFLKDLDIHLNNFMNIPSSISNLSNLVRLNIKDTPYGIIPQPVFELENLQYLNIKNTLISSVPEDITKLNRLRELHLASNPVTTISELVSLLDSLEVLDISSTDIQGDMPNNLFNLKELRELYAQDIDLQEIPIEIANCDKLEIVNFSDNHLSNLLPLADCENLKRIFVLDNLMEDFPMELQVLENLTDLNLSNNFIQGIPQDINDGFPKLVNLLLQNNEIESLSPEIVQLDSLRVLSIRDNKCSPFDIKPIVGQLPLINYSPQDSIYQKEVYSFNSDTTIIVNATLEGDANIYQWVYNGALLEGATSPQLTITANDTAGIGTYTCYIRDPEVFGLVIWRNEIEVIYNGILPMQLDAISQNNVSCHAGNDGMIAFEVNEGSGEFSFQWTNNVSSSNIAQNLSAGNYTVTVSDEINQSQVIQDFYISEPPELVLNAQSSEIFNNEPASILINTDGGTPPYIYQWSHDSLLTENAIEVYEPGTYEAIVSDANGCMKNIVIEVELYTSTSEFLENEFKVFPNPLSVDDLTLIFNTLCKKFILILS